MKKFSKEHKAKIADAERKFYSTEEGKTVIVTRNKLQSRTKKEFYQTSNGKERARQHSEAVKAYYHTPKGKALKEKLRNIRLGKGSWNKGIHGLSQLRHSEEWKAKHSALMKGKPNPHRGHPASKKQIAVLIARNEGRRGYKHTDEWKSAQSRLKKGQPRSFTAVWRQHISEATQRPSRNIKIKNALSGRPKSDLHKEHLADSKRKFFRLHPEEKERMREIGLKSVTPKKDTSPEVKIQKQLTKIGIAYEKHKVISRYKTDIYIPTLNLCIFADGCAYHPCPIHLNRAHKPFNDTEKRTREEFIINDLHAKGYKVIRIWEHDIKKIDFDISKYLNIDGSNTQNI